MISAKAVAVGPRKSYSVCIGQADFENDCKIVPRVGVLGPRVDMAIAYRPHHRLINERVTK